VFWQLENTSMAIINVHKTGTDRPEKRNHPGIWNTKHADIKFFTLQPDLPR